MPQNPSITGDKRRNLRASRYPKAGGRPLDSYAAAVTALVEVGFGPLKPIALRQTKRTLSEAMKAGF